MTLEGQHTPLWEKGSLPPRRSLKMPGSMNSFGEWNSVEHQGYTQCDAGLARSFGSTRRQGVYQYVFSCRPLNLSAKVACK